MSTRVVRARLALASAVTFAVASVGYITGLPGYWFLALLLIGVLSAPVGISTGRPGRYIVWRSTWVAATGVWLACAVTWSPWVLATAVTWLASAITVVMVTPVMATHTETAGMLQRAFTGPGVEWRDRIKRVARIDVPPPDITRWENKHGYTVEGEFYQGGHTWEDLAGKAKNLASDLRLPDGCSVEVDQGGHQAAYQIHVTTRDAFGGGDYPPNHPNYNPNDDFLPLPDITPGSIYDPAPLGVYANGDIATITGLRQNSVLIAGTTGGGKSGAASTLLCWHTTRRDQVTYVIDLTGGRLGRPFMQPYLDGVTDRPAIDGLADTPERAEALLTWLRDVAVTRPVVYRQAMIDADDDKIPVYAPGHPTYPDGIPAIRLVIDEPKTIWGNPRLAKLTAGLIEQQETTRAVALRPDYTALAGTLGALPAELKRHLHIRFATQAADIGEVAYVLDWGNVKGLSMRALLKRPGMAYLKQGATVPRLMRWWRSKPSTIYTVATQAAGIRPNLDPAATQLPSYKAIADRWDWQRQTAVTPREPAMATSTPHPQDEYDNAMAQAAAVEREKAELIARLDAQSEQQNFDRLAASAAPEPVRAAITAYLGDHGEASTGDIISHLQANGHDLTRQTLQTKISELATDGVITKAGHGRYRYP